MFQGISTITQALYYNTGIMLVVTSPLPMAVETAIGMGFAVSMTHPGVQDIGKRILEHVGWDDGYGYMDLRRSIWPIPLVRVLRGLRHVADLRLAR